MSPLQEALLSVEAWVKYNIIVELWDIANVVELEATASTKQEDEVMQEVGFMDIFCGPVQNTFFYNDVQGKTFTLFLLSNI